MLGPDDGVIEQKRLLLSQHEDRFGPIRESLEHGGDATGTPVKSPGTTPADRFRMEWKPPAPAFAPRKRLRHHAHPFTQPWEVAKGKRTPIHDHGGQGARPLGHL